MKKFLIICLSIFLVGGFIKYSYTASRCKNIDYAVEHYFTTGLFNSYKMYSIDTIDLSFSNTNIAVVKIGGMTQKSPHKRVAYSVFLEKNSNGTWKVEKIYPEQVTTRGEE